MSNLKLKVLLDNHTLIDRYFLGEPGLSFYLECDGETILFDTGYSDAFLRNGQKMGVDFSRINQIILSHGHLDHTWGLTEWIRLYSERAFEGGDQAPRPFLTCHPDALREKHYRSANLPQIGSLLNSEPLSHYFQLQLTSHPLWLTEHLLFLGEIPRENDFEAKSPIGEQEGEPDYLLDDTGVVFRSDAGLVIIVGCAHAGICNIIEYAKQATGEDRVLDVIGGFHLLTPQPKQLQGTLEYLRELKPRGVYACHCTDLASKIALSQAAPIREVGVGLELNW